MHASQDAPLLTVRDLTIRFRNGNRLHDAVKRLNFYLQKGETLGIVGESGSGKSVTALSILNLIANPRIKMEGNIYYNSRAFGEVDLLQIPQKMLREIRGKEISMIFQDPMSSLNPVFTCGNQVAENLLIHGSISKSEAKEKCLELFEKVKLENPKKINRSYPHELSGGMKQRVMIAMALACKPAILIADEPTTALDVGNQAIILELIQELRDDENTSTIFISHDLGVIAELADRVMVMYQGEVMESGSVWDMFATPRHPYTKGLLACRPRLSMQLEKLPVVSDFMKLDGHGNISSFTDSRFKSVGEALLSNAESRKKSTERVEQYITQLPILKIKNLKTYFSEQDGGLFKKSSLRKAVDDVSLKVFPGETLGLVGESGCGKTTLGRSILRLVEPTAGQIIFEGRDVTQFNKKQLRGIRKKMQIIFQDPYASLNPRLSIGEAILEPMRIHKLHKNEKTRKERGIELLKLVGLEADHFKRYPHEFSGGQRQRICIARTLAVEPSFIICDESVSALDVSVQAQVLNLLNELKAKLELTYIFISHDLSVVKFISDRIAVMQQGKIVEINSAHEIYKEPQSEYTKSLIQKIPKGDLEDIRKADIKRKMKQKAMATSRQ